MKIEMGEQIVASWLKHIKHCVVVNTNWKASPYWVPAVSDGEIGSICTAANEYFNGEDLRILDISDENAGENDDGVWQNMLLQTECDVVGVAHSAREQGKQLIYAVESAFHRNNIHYSKQKRSWRPLGLSGATVTAWNVALKMFKNALSMYRWYGVKDAHIVFVAPKSSESVENEILNVCNNVVEFYREQGFAFEFEFYFEHTIQGSSGSFSECIKNPVNLAATIVDDTSELYLRSHILDADTQSIDVLMLHKARRLLECESIDEMSGSWLDSPGNLLDAIEEIGRRIVTRSLFNRCHGALRAYYAVLHNLDRVPTIQDLRNQRRDAGSQSIINEGVVTNGDSRVEIVLNPKDEGKFKRALLRTRVARRTREYADNRNPVVDEWRADHFTENSNLMGNIKSSAAYRNARRDGVVRLRFDIING